MYPLHIDSLDRSCCTLQTHHHQQQVPTSQVYSHFVFPWISHSLLLDLPHTALRSRYWLDHREQDSPLMRTTPFHKHSKISLKHPCNHIICRFHDSRIAGNDEEEYRSAHKLTRALPGLIKRPTTRASNNRSTCDEMPYLRKTVLKSSCCHIE